MNTAQVAEQFIRCYRSENPASKYELYSEDCISIERPIGKDFYEVKGLVSIKEKSKSFYRQFNEIVSRKVSEPILDANTFTVTISIEYLKDGEKKILEELCIFSVENGKISREEFIYEFMGNF